MLNGHSWRRIRIVTANNAVLAALQIDGISIVKLIYSTVLHMPYCYIPYALSFDCISYVFGHEYCMNFYFDCTR